MLKILSKDKREIFLGLLVVIFAFFCGLGLLEAFLGGLSLGNLTRKMLPVIFVGGLIISLPFLNLTNFSFFSKSYLTYKQVMGLIVSAVILGIAVPWSILAECGLTTFLIILVIIVGFLASVYSTISGNSSLGVAIFLLTFPFLSFFEYYYGGKYAFFSGIEWGPLILTPTISFLLVLFFVSLIKRLQEEISHKFRSPVIKAIFIFIFILLISSFCSKFPLQSIRCFILMWLYPLLLFFIILRNIRTANDLRLFAHAALACVCLISFFSLYFFLRYTDEPSAVQNIYGSILATNISSGTWGQMVALSIPLSLVLFSLSKGVGKIVYLLVLGLLFFSMVLSFSRLSLLAVLVVVPIFLVERRIRLIVFSSLTILILIFIFYKSLLSNYVLYRFQNIHSVNELIYDSSVQARWEGMKAAISMTKDYPLLGIGPGMWKDYVYRYAKMQRVVSGTDWGGKYKYGLGYIEDAHSLHLQIAADSGILGFIAWIFLLSMIFKEAFYILRKSRNHFRYSLMLGMFSSLFVFVVISFFGGFDLRLFLGAHFMFWIIVAMIVKLKDLEQLYE